ncbi:snoRNA-binding rRNA-processing protein NOP14 [Sporobolomyces salmoneus]|uniref:snoRNA-binding rRNA-processing protein NOP14 n=1 Tax=Sporobolomyces salmoneus TaxID=183962 RepID=UPI0031765ABD
MGGSQLKQLKTSLKSSGLSRTSNPKDKKKQAKQRKDLSSNSLAHRNAKLEAIHDKFNLFDVRDEKKKFEVVTRRGEVEGGKKGMPGKARAAGIETRKKTLLPMLDARTHSSTFLDHRFGETSTNLTPEEKALERFTAERQSRLGKKAKFNLEDDDEGGFELTHGGRTLGFGDEEELESGGWGGLGVSEGANREPLLKRRKMGVEPDEEDEPERKKTHAEIMEEVVAKSKFHKAERKRMRSADDETRLGLDADLKDLRTILGGSARMPASSRPTDSSTSTATLNDKDVEEDDSEEESDEEDEEGDLEEGDSDVEDGSDSEGSTYELNDEELEAALAASSAKSGVDRDLLRKLIGSAADRSPSPPPVASTSTAPAFDENEDVERPLPAKVDEEDKDPYDNYVRMLALEPRAHATNRMKTPLELAQQAAEELKEREEKRLKRQRGERDDSSDEEGPDGKKDKKGKGKRVPQADDLDDDFLEEGFGGGLSDAEDEEGLGKGLEGLKAEAESEGEEQSAGEEEESGSEEEGEDEDEDEMDVGDLSAEDSEEEVVEGETEALVAPTKSTKAAPGAELPFTFPCPSTHGEFVRLLTSSNIKEEDTPLVVKRIRTLYHPGLAVGNKEKLQVFANVLLDHIIYLAASSSSSAFRTINSLLPPLLTLSHAYPLSCAPHYVSKLRLMHKNFLRGLSKGPLDPSAKTWPGPAELTLLRVVGMVWSTSDLSHPVSAAAQLLNGEYLAQARVRNLSDLASGLFLCTLSAQYERDSKRLTPESTNFILAALLLLLPTSLTSKSLPCSFPIPDFQQEHAKGLKVRTLAKGEKAKVEIESSERVNLMEAIRHGKTSASTQDAEQLKVNLIKTALALMTDARERYSGSEAFVELFQPAETVLKAVKSQKLPSSIKNEVSTTLSTLSKSLTFALQSRKPLTLQHHRAIPIATYLPKFDEGFNPNRRFDPDTERAAQSKLRALYKKEKKGAVRELRKDNKFLAVEEAKRKKTDDAAYEKKITKIMGSLQDERAEEKAFEREKTRGKRRDKARRG